MGGQVDRLLGDAVLATFGWPIAHEDDALRAVHAALELHAAVDRLRLEVRFGCAIKMHSGVNSGEVIIDEVEIASRTTGPMGDTVNVASRLLGIAAPRRTMPSILAVAAVDIRSS
jgi:class 3 adenylate cyclase